MPFRDDQSVIDLIPRAENMADIFHFSSSHKRTFTTFPSRPSPRNRPGSVKRRHAITTEMYSQRACMAQHQDPVFRPNEDLSAFVSGSLLNSVPASAQDTPIACDFHYDDDLDDEEVGGVLLPPTSPDEPMTDAPDDAGQASLGTPVNLFAGNEHPVEELRAMIHPSISIAARRPSHPRPLAADTLEEEDGRRQRFALGGTEAREEEPGFDLDAAISHGVATFGSGDGNLTAMLQTLLRANSVAQLPQDVRQQSTHDEQSTTQGAVNTAQRPVFHQLYSTDMDDDALGVDDPRRHYDFAEFMDAWRLYSMCDKSLPPFEPGAQPSMRLWRPPEQLNRVLPAGVDHQGIRWQLIGPSREHAMLARSMMHPSRTPHTYKAHLQKARDTCIQGARQYTFRSFAPQHKAQTQHYQLRNVVAASSRNSVFYAVGNQVTQASLACPTWQQTVMDLNKPASCAAGFRITCLSATPTKSIPGYVQDNVLIAGGFHGEYAILNVDGEERRTSEGFVTHGYDGLVTHIHNYNDRRSGVLRAAFCSNDRHLRLMDVSTLTFTDSFKYDHAINCSVTSSDGRLRALVGDSTETLITDAEKGTSLVTLKEHTDHIFACAWSQDGRYVATGAQDGIVNVWDARKWSKPLRALESTMSCTRSLHFTNTGALVAAENDDVVKIYDGVKFDSHQDIRFFGSIAGVALLDGGAEIVIANSDKTVGGLLTFERQSQGLGNGTYKHKVAKAGSSGSSRWRSGRSQDEGTFVDDLHV